MIDHFTLTVSDLGRSKAFYESVLAPLGFGVKMSFEEFVGFGDHKPYFWLKKGVPQAPMHIAFAAKDRPAVDGFHRAALQLGATDNGQPGIREEYHANYYGAFVSDPDGHPIEAVCHAAPGAAKKAVARKPAAKKKPAPKKKSPAKRRSR
jgi:catechol 2,3-dioxygenase-like lactoylglutathione lyase family enzyme